MQNLAAWKVLRERTFDAILEQVFAVRDGVDEAADLIWQGSLFGSVAPSTDERAPIVRHQLDEHSWIDHSPAFGSAPDAVLAHLLTELVWEQREMKMFDQIVWQPRLSADADVGDESPPLRRDLDHVEAHYGMRFDRYFVNLYRNGDDSVAWHTDKIGAVAHEPLVVIFSYGARRTFRIRPKDGGRSTAFSVGHGDLLVMGGRCQHDWEHSVPKTRRGVGPRISFTARHWPQDPPGPGDPH